MNWLKRLFTENLPMKLLAFVLAVMLWALVGGDVQSEIFLSVPVEFRNVPEDIEFEASPSRVEVRVRGLGRIVRQSGAGDFSVPIDMSGVRPGVREIPLSPQDVQAPVTLEILQVSPQRLTVTVARPQASLSPGERLGSISR